MDVVVEFDPAISGLEWVQEPEVVRVGSEVSDEGLESFDEAVRAAEASPLPVVPVLINSEGGDVYSLLHMVETLRRVRSKPVATIVCGKAFSAAATLFTCGHPDHRYIAEHGTLMVHEVTGDEVGGSASDIGTEADEIARLNDVLFCLMDDNCGKRRGYFKRLAGRGVDVYLDRAGALQHGLATVAGTPTFRVDVAVTSSVVCVQGARKRRRKIRGPARKN